MTMTVARRPVIDALRSATASRHARLDADFAANDHLRDTFHLGEYLRAVASVHRAVEAAVHHSPVLSDTGFSPKTGLVERDLARLDLEPTAHPAPSIFLDGNSAVLGALYATEGSTLGGREIARLVRLRFTGKPASATSFLDPYEDVTLARWRRTTAAIEEWVDDRDEAQRSAIAVFDLFAQALEPIASTA